MHHLHRPSVSSTTRSTGAASAMVARASNDIDPSRVVSAPADYPAVPAWKRRSDGATCVLARSSSPPRACTCSTSTIAATTASRDSPRRPGSPRPGPPPKLSRACRTSITTLWSSTPCRDGDCRRRVAAVRAHCGREQFRTDEDEVESRAGLGKNGAQPLAEPAAQRVQAPPGAGKSNSVPRGIRIRKRVICGAHADAFLARCVLLHPGPRSAYPLVAGRQPVSHKGRRGSVE